MVMNAQDVIDRARKRVKYTPIPGPAMYPYFGIKRAVNEHPSGMYRL